MNNGLKELECWVCDVNGTRSRFLNDEEFMMECIVMATQDGCFAALGKAIAAQDKAAAFDAAHTLKGVLANTGITPLYRLINEMTEILRQGTMNGTDAVYAELMQKRGELLKLLEL